VGREVFRVEPNVKTTFQSICSIFSVGKLKKGVILVKSAVYKVFAGKFGELGALVGRAKRYD